MKLRTAKKIALASSCGKVCGHRWGTIETAVARFQRGMRAGSRLVGWHLDGLQYWPPKQLYECIVNNPFFGYIFPHGSLEVLTEAEKNELERT
jgi:hypothetical protein